ncbi:AMP-binding protein [Actinospica durhamensis]|uniref:AMP-binding protein n=1 Tax=Actinospica durhamensis TaxID=1508375 RepID=A0A941ITK3_9ACTN|nr:AMP-binding protein [Actinospica durhamensis]MBR7836083.1 AMP-binding protein [Actinospica durhamensis]
MAPIGLDARLRELAHERPEHRALVTVDHAGAEETLTWQGLEELSARVAQGLESAAVDGAVLVPAPTGAEALANLLGVLRAGATALVVEPSLRPAALEPAVHAIAQRTGRTVRRLDGDVMARPQGSDTAPRGPGGGAVLLTGGTSGAPKPVLRPGAPVWDEARGAPLLYQRTGWRSGQVQLVAGAWSHAAPYTHLIEAVLSGNTILAPRLFDPAVVLAAMARHRPAWTQLTPTHMQLLAPSLAGVPEAVGALQGVLHTAGPCAPRTRHAWIEAIGARRLHEMYASTEGIGVTLCRADEWLSRPDTVGRGFFTRIRIHDEQTGRILPPGQVGTVYMRTSAAPTVTLAGGPAERDGYRTVHDLGRLDEAGYLYLEGRADDMVVIGGENVHTDRAAAALLDHARVRDAAVVAVPDEVLGNRLVALVVPVPADPGPDGGPGLTPLELTTHCLARLSPRETPGEFRLVGTLDRTAAGKVRREVLERMVEALR